MGDIEAEAAVGDSHAVANINGIGFDRHAEERTIQVFTQALVIGGTTGAPAESTLMYMVVLYRAAFRYFNVGFAAAMATVLFLVVLLLTLLIFRTARSWVYYEGESR